MALLPILHFPDPRLRTIAKPVDVVDNKIRQIVADMFETMYAAPGIGLAATQVNIHQRIIVVDITSEKTRPLCLINPEIIEYEGHQVCEEGCLSVPNIHENIERAGQVTVKALNEQGEVFTVSAEELLAVCIQHEMDHLEGKLFVDYLSPLKRQRIRTKLEKQSRQQERKAS